MKSTQHQQECAILLTTHFIDDYILYQLEKLEREVGDYGDLYVLFQSDNIKSSWKYKYKHYDFNYESLSSLGYQPWSDTIVPGSNHFPLLLFYKDNPQYLYYWNIEYDVCFSGNWSDFFSFFKDKKEDFISSHIETKEDNPEWNRWNEMELQGISIQEDRYVKSFNPIYRISGNALAFLDRFLKCGHRGHHELLIPTVLNENGFNLADLGGHGRFCYNGYENLFYIGGQSHHPWYMDSTMRYRPVFRLEDMSVVNKLYHPIKQETFRQSMTIKNAFNRILRETDWMKNKNCDTSGYATDEGFLTILMDLLNKENFLNILDLGCGQSTMVFSQYCQYKKKCRLYSVESDLQWAKKLQEKYTNLDILSYVHYYPDMQEEMSSYLGLSKKLIESGHKFDFISVDGPIGYKCRMCSRVNILEIISNDILSDQFVIILHDTNRLPEKKMKEMCKLILKKKGIKFNEYEIDYGKGTSVLMNIIDDKNNEKA
jgi:hypothetical protein